jgi:hypothetical protein
MSATGILDIVLSTAQYFPTAVGVTLGVAGLATARLPWLFAASGLVPLAFLIWVLQIFAFKITGQHTTAGHIYEMCSLAPIPGPTPRYAYAPSTWMTLTAYLITVLMASASVVATSKPASTTTNAALPVQQRKGVGTLSILACVILTLFLLLLRYRTGCEGIIGLISGFILGGSFGALWWAVMRAGGPAAWDVHGVMLGTQPGSLRTTPLACLPSANTQA